MWLAEFMCKVNLHIYSVIQKSETTSKNDCISYVFE